jgi:hypothetical protein
MLVRSGSSEVRRGVSYMYRQEKANMPPHRQEMQKRADSGPETKIQATGNKCLCAALNGLAKLGSI